MEGILRQSSRFSEVSLRRGISECDGNEMGRVERESLERRKEPRTGPWGTMFVGSSRGLRKGQRFRRRTGRKREREFWIEKTGLLVSPSGCDRSGYLRMKGALNLAFKSLFCTLLAGWLLRKLRTKDEAEIEWKGESGSAE